MAGNVGCGFIQGTGDYINVETSLGVTLEADKYYNVQIQGKGTVCESATKPTQGGTYWNTIEPFGYIKADQYLWIKPYEGDTVFINIAE